MPEARPSPNLYLIGPRACGKTTVGRLAAALLGLPFVDADQRLVEILGQDVSRAVAAHGWPWFREREGEVLAALDARGGLVVACGGGVVLAAANREVLARGRCVYVRCPAQVLAARLSADPLHGQRPSLTGRPLDEEVAEVLAEREPLYLSCADLVVSGEEAPEAVAARIVEGLAVRS